MRVLLDENVPRKLKYRFGSEHSVTTVQESGWSGLENGALLAAADEKFEAFVTLDRGLVYQQDLSTLNIRVVVIRSLGNRYEDLLPLVPAVESVLERLSAGEVAHVAG